MFPFKLKANFIIYRCFVHYLHSRSPAIPGQQRREYNVKSNLCKSLFQHFSHYFLSTTKAQPVAGLFFIYLSFSPIVVLCCALKGSLSSANRNTCSIVLTGCTTIFCKILSGISVKSFLFSQGITTNLIPPR